MSEQDKKFKLAVKWTLLVFGAVFVIFGYLIPLIKYVIFNINIDNSYLNWTGIGLTCVSLVFAIVSVIYTSFESKKTNDFFRNVQKMLEDTTKTLTDIRVTAEVIKSKQESSVTYIKSENKEVDKMDKSKWDLDLTE